MGIHNFAIYNFIVGRDGLVGITIRYGLEGPGIEFRWRRDFVLPSTSALSPTQPPVQRVSCLFPGDKATGAWRWHIYHRG